MLDVDADSAETPDKLEKSVTPKGRGEWHRWNLELKSGQKLQEPYLKRVDEIRKRYKDDRTDEEKAKRYNVFYSVIQTMLPNIYMDPPTPYVHRRFMDQDSAARDAGWILERALKWHVDDDENLDDELSSAADNLVMFSRGVTWLRYKPIFALRFSADKNYINDNTDVPEGSEVGEDDQGSFYREQYEKKVAESQVLEHVSPEDFLHGAAAKWRHVPWVARRVLMTREELIERFGEEKGDKIPLKYLSNGARRGTNTKTDDDSGLFGRAEIWEIWDRVRKQVIWLCQEWSEDILDKKKDPLKLEGFFPCPKPMFDNVTDDSLIPTPLYVIIQDILNDLDEIANRISVLTEAIRAVGVYSSEMGDILKRVFSHTAENEMIPVDAWAAFAEKGGLKGCVDWLPIDQVVQCIEKLQASKAALLQELYDVSGMADIVRGSSDPRETAKAQSIKGSFATKRLQKKQRIVKKHAARILQMMTEIMVTFYDERLLQNISGAKAAFQLPAQEGMPPGQFDEARWQRAYQLLKDDHQLYFRIKVDTEDLSGDAMKDDMAMREQFLTGYSQLLGAAIPAIQQVPNIAPVVGELLKFGVRGFPMARSLENNIEQAVDAFVAEPPKPPTGTEAPQPAGADSGTNGADMQIAQLQSQLDQAKIQLQQQKQQAEQQLGQAKLQLEHAKFELDKQVKLGELQRKTQKDHVDASISHQQVQQQAHMAENQRAVEEQRLNQDAQTAQHSMQLETQQAERTHDHDTIRLAMQGQNDRHGRKMTEAQLAASKAQN